MSAVDEILSSVDLNQLAQQVGADPTEVEQAARTALPALLGGLNANAADPAGAASLTEALGQHDPSLVEGGVDLARVDPADGERISQHIFGGNQEQVVSRLGGVGGGVSKGLVAKLLPILAPIVMSWLANRVLGKAGAAGGAAGGGTPAGGSASPTAGGGLGSILGQVLGGATKGAQSGGVDTGSIITDVLGGLLGGGRR